MYAQQYVHNEVLHVEPVELVCLLYSKAIEKLNQARRHLDAGRIEERNRAIACAMEILVELQGSLDEQGGEIAVNLARLYDYMQQRLVEAMTAQTAAPIEESAELLSTLCEGWNEIRTRSGESAGPEETAETATVPPETAETAEKRSWTL